MIPEVETQDDPRRAVRRAMPAMISPQTSVKVVGGYGTSVSHMLAMVFEDPSIDVGLHEPLAAHEVVLGKEWADGRPRLGLVCATEAMRVWNNGRRPATRRRCREKIGHLAANSPRQR
jgi:hypothetical protein